MFTSSVRKYVIDLSVPERERWAHVIRREVAPARRLAREAQAEGEVVPEAARRAATWLLKQGYALSRGRYRGEIAAWADALELSAAEMTALNCAYELSHAGELVLEKGWPRAIFGCTGGVRWLDGTGLVHVRNLDWPLSKIGQATRLFEFQDGGREFTVVGILGYVGALSGMVPGAYSATINWAPPVNRPSFRFGPAFLLREVFETCDTYAEAVEALSETPVSTPVFFTVCGTGKSQACVIERRPKAAAVRRIRTGTLVQANHHVARKFRDRDDYWDSDEEAHTDSLERADVLKDELAGLSAASSLEDAASCLDVEPVRNDETGQQMAFCPATGEVRVWRRGRRA